MKNQALFSKHKDYRYMLSRVWDDKKPTLGIIGLSPSYGDASVTDKETQKQVAIANALGYGSIYVLNLFAFIESQDQTIFDIEDPIGPNNDRYLERYLARCDKVLCVWGNDGQHLDRSQALKNRYDNLYYIKRNKTGEPAKLSTINGEKRLTKFDTPR